MDIALEIREGLREQWLPFIYRHRIRPLRTRAQRLEVAERENTAEILHSLLGVELKVGKRRISCPDLSTARYLQVFARLGCNDVAVPYDITKISRLADALESSWQRTLLLLAAAAKDKTPQAAGKLRTRLVRELRREINEVGPGNIMPEFNQTTKQKRL
jgi:hypothetical protein